MTKVYMENTEDGHSKFWEANLAGQSVGVHWGRIGTAGQYQVKDFPSEEDALDFFVRKKQEKIGHGYRDVDEQQIANNHTPRTAEIIEARTRARRRNQPASTAEEGELDRYGLRVRE